MKTQSIQVNKEYIKIWYDYISSKINIFFNNRENTFFILFIALLLSFTWYMDFSELTIKKFTTVWMVLILSYLAFYNHQNVEKFLLSNFTKVLFSISVWLFFLQPYFWINNTDLMLMWWAIFAFWYWYKKYERDKELVVIEKYTNEYDNIHTKLETWSDGYNKVNVMAMIALWNKEFFLASKWYVSEELWKEWTFWMQKDLWKFLFHEIDIQIAKTWTNQVKLKEMIFIRYFIDYFKEYPKNALKNDWLTFPEFILKLIKQIQKHSENTKESTKYFEEVYKKIKNNI